VEQRELLEELCTRPPMLHPRGEEFVCWTLLSEVLRWLYETVEPGWNTLETGSGCSTIVFAMRGARHTAVTPRAAEFERIAAFCRERGVALDDVTFVAERSQDALHGMRRDQLDLVLIDGDHAFPVPFMDWFYTAERLKIGGLVVVDNTEIATGRVLSDFLAKEEGRWRERRTFSRTTVFEKVSHPSTEGVWWGLQPWTAQAPLPYRAREWVQGKRQAVSRRLSRAKPAR
jgi:predicted O-methyltransferase YrrM